MHYMQCVIYIICTLSMVINLFVSVCIAGDYERSQPLGKRLGPRTFPSLHFTMHISIQFFTSQMSHVVTNWICFSIFTKAFALYAPPITFKMWWKWCPASKIKTKTEIYCSQLCKLFFHIHIHTRCDIFTFSFTARYCGGHIMKEATTYARDAVSMHKNK